MKRLLTTLVILLVVLAAGLTALVVMVNPNDFRTYLVEQVAEKTDYQLTFNNQLRWHVWPTLSILTDNIALKPKKVSLPTISAENLRLDVKLWPLLSHQLKIANVTLKRAVIQLPYPSTPPQLSANSPVITTTSPATSQDIPVILPNNANKHWQWLVDTLDIEDSLLVVEEKNDNAINFRQLNVHLQRETDRQFNVSLASQINRNQRNLAINLAALVNLADYPQQLTLNVNQLNYQLNGIGLPMDGLQGSGQMQVSYQADPQAITIKPFNLSINGSQLQGQLLAQLESTPTYQLQLTSSQIDLDKIFSVATQQPVTNPSNLGAPTLMAAPVISSADLNPDSPSSLTHWNGQLQLTIDKLQYRHSQFQQLKLQLDNQQGELTLKQLQGQLQQGHFSLQGSSDKTANNRALTANYQNIDLASLWSLLQRPSYLTGKISGSSQIVLDKSFRFNPHWWQYLQADNQVTITDASLQGINLLGLVSHNAQRLLNKSLANHESSLNTELQQMASQFHLTNGQLQIEQLTGQTPQLALQATGDINLLKQQCDMQLQLQLADEWLKQHQLFELLQGKTVPMHIYGPFNQLHYQVQLDKLLKNDLQQQLQQRLQDWLGKKPLIH